MGRLDSFGTMGAVDAYCSTPRRVIDERRAWILLEVSYIVDKII